MTSTIKTLIKFNTYKSSLFLALKNKVTHGEFVSYKQQDFDEYIADMWAQEIAAANVFSGILRAVDFVGDLFPKKFSHVAEGVRLLAENESLFMDLSIHQMRTYLPVRENFDHVSVLGVWVDKEGDMHIPSCTDSWKSGTDLGKKLRQTADEGKDGFKDEFWTEERMRSFCNFVDDVHKERESRG